MEYLITNENKKNTKTKDILIIKPCECDMFFNLLLSNQIKKKILIKKKLFFLCFP